MEPLRLLIFRSQSKWHPFAGEATEGPLKGGGSPKWVPPLRVGRVGEKNIRIPMWCWVQKRCGSGPMGNLLAPAWGMHTCIPSLEKGIPIWRISVYHPTPWYLDFCLSPGGQALAVPYDPHSVSGAFQIDGNGQPVVLLPSGDFGVRAYARQQEGQTLTFTPRIWFSTFSLQDQDGNIWDEYGRCLLKDGPSDRSCCTPAQDAPGLFDRVV